MSRSLVSFSIALSLAVLPTTPPFGCAGAFIGSPVDMSFEFERCFNLPFLYVLTLGAMATDRLTATILRLRNRWSFWQGLLRLKLGARVLYVRAAGVDKRSLRESRLGGQDERADRCRNYRITNLHGFLHWQSNGALAAGLPGVGVHTLRAKARFP